MNPVTPLAIRVYEFIEQHYRLTGLYPSYKEIGAALGYSKGSTIYFRMQELRAAGWISGNRRAYQLCREPKTFYVEKVKA